MNQHDINEREWRDPANWHAWAGIYGSPRDTRLLVPKRTPWMGWTFNCSHPAIGYALAAVAVAPLVFLLAQRMLR